MPLEPNSNLLHYRLIAQIGEGGMGVVWKATDTTLDREVAIKILPAQFAADAERLSRFEREAKLLASLNHPNIAAVYGLHEAEGVRFLAMELVDGEDLSEKLGRGAMAMDAALEAAGQVAAALEAAHGAGVIHRDLKPANIVINNEGQVKVLDFGLAKALDPSTSSGSGDPSSSPTMTSAGTVAGMILGTASYMAPEQARGKPVDRRADIWSFGAVLYEMLCGTKAFPGETITDTIAAVVKEDPDWSKLPADLSPAVVQTMQRCLAKKRKERFRDIGDVHWELEHLDMSDDSGSDQPASGMFSSPWAKITAVMALLLVGALLGKFIGGGKGAEERPGMTMRRLIEAVGPETQPDLSPDGRMLVYASSASGNRDIYFMRVGGDRAINLTSGFTGQDGTPAFSPDGERIAFRSERDGGGIFTMGATGESVRRVTEFGYDPAWSPDGKTIVFATEEVYDPYSRNLPSTLWVVDLESGETTEITAIDAVQPAWSPVGERIAYWANTGGQRDIWTVPAGGGERVAVTQDLATDWSPVWSPDGRTLYFSSDRNGSMNLWGVAIDPETGAVTGEPFPVTSGTRSVGYACLSAGGDRMVVMSYDRTFDVTLYDMDALLQGRLEVQGTLPRQSNQWCAPSYDATWLACTTTGAQEDLVVVSRDGSETRRLMDDVHKDRGAVWSPDGQSLAFYSTRGGVWDYWWMRADGSGLKQLSEVSDFGGGAMSPDGKQLTLNANFEAVAILDVDLEKPVTVETARKLKLPDGYPVGRFWPGAWSEDGRFLAGNEAYENGNRTTYAVYDLEEETLRTLPGIESGKTNASVGGWLPDSRRLLLEDDRGLMLVDTRTDEHRVLHEGFGEYTMFLSRDGKTLMVETETPDSEIWMLTLE